MTDPVDLKTLSDEQLEARFNELHDELPDGGHFGWDWPTLRASLPELYEKLHAIRVEARRRLRVNGRFLNLTSHRPPAPNKETP